MRSRSVLQKLDTGQSRFELCHQAFQAIRKLHHPGNRIPETTSYALQRLAGAEREKLSAVSADATAAAVELIPEQVSVELQAGAQSSEPIADTPGADLDPDMPGEHAATSGRLISALRVESDDH